MNLPSRRRSYPWPNRGTVAKRPRYSGPSMGSVWKAGWELAKRTVANMEKAAGMANRSGYTSRVFSNPTFSRGGGGGGRVVGPSRRWIFGGGGRGATTSAPRSRKQFTGKGRFVGPFRRGRTIRASAFAKYGFKMRTEKGGSVSQDKCVYIGHATCGRAKLIRVFWHACLRQLMMKAGHTFGSFKEVISPNATVKMGTIRIDYQNSDDGLTQNAITVNLGVGDTYENVATTMQTQWDATIGTADYSVRLRALRYIPQADETNGADVHEFKLDMTHATFTWKVTSNLKIQNRTLAATGAGDGEHQHHGNSVENNPLQGKVYYKMGDGFVYRWSNDTANTFKLVADDASAVITGDPDEATLSTELQDLLQRPPAATQFFNCKKSGFVKLGPGLIKSSNLTYGKTLSVHAFLNALHAENESASQHTFKYAKTRMFCLEKMMHTDDADEPDINIGYECNTFYQGLVRTRLPTITVDKDIL